MNISKENAERLQEIASEMVELLNEYKHIARGAMNDSERHQFRYNTLAHLEPGLHSDHEWVVGSHVKGLDRIAELALEECNENEDNENEQEVPAN